MLSKLFSSAKNLLPVSSQAKDTQDDLNKDEMVTTRGQSTPSRVEGVHDWDATIVIGKRSRASGVEDYAEPSSSKRQRAVDSVQSSSEKSRKLKVHNHDVKDRSVQSHPRAEIVRSTADSQRNRQSSGGVDNSAETDGSTRLSPVNGEEVRNTHPVVEILVKSRSPLQALSAQPKKRRAMPSKDAADGQVVEFSDEEDQLLWLKSSEKRYPVPKQPEQSQGFRDSMNNRLSMEFNRSTDSNANYEIFSSDGPEEHLFSTAPEQQEPGSEDSKQQESESENDGPEEVSTAKDTTVDKQHASKSTAKQPSISERRTFTQGVETENNTERRTTRIRMFHEGVESKFGLDGADDSSFPEPASATLQETGSPIATSKPFKFTKLPNLLPAEYLEDREFQPQIFTQMQIGKKTKFTDVDHKFKDRRVGSTTIRIAEVLKTHLAPKASPQAKSIKEAWLLGRAGTKKKPFKSGFFK